MKKKIILASSSPRRKQILESIGLEFEIIPSSFEEVLDDLSFSYEKIEDLAYNKALCVAKEIQMPSLVIGVDTVVVLNNMILCKPEDKKNAKDMLKKLSGETHFVVTSTCIINTENNEKQIQSETSYVEFETLTAEMIDDYVDNYNPLDKAGAYGIQELPAGFVKEINGSLENIIGLCPSNLKKMLREFDIVTL